MPIALRIRTPIICLLVVLTIIIHFKQHKHLKSEGTKIFKYFLYIALIFISSIGTMEITAFYRDIVPFWFNNILDNIIYISMILLCYMYTFFIMNFIEIKKKGIQEKNKLVLKLTSIIGCVSLCFFPTKFIVNEPWVYTFGIKALIAYVVLTIYIIFNLYYLIASRKVINNKNYKCFIETMFIFLFTYISQAIFPYITITYMAFTLETIILYLNFENIEKYICEDTNLFNENAFYKILDEKIFQKSKEKIFLYAFNTIEIKRDSNNILKDFKKLLNSNKYEGYKLSENVVAIFSKEKPQFLNKYEEELNYVTTKTTFLGEICEEEIKEFIKNNYDTQLYLDKMTKVFNRNKYELDIKDITTKNNDLWYVIVDINNLKETNDTLGHLAGDKLIQSTANVIKESFPNESSIYRIGGDEFVILTSLDNIEKNIIELYKKCDEAKEEISISFAMGYKKYRPKVDVYEEIVRKADKSMYENKKEIKEKLKKQES